MIPPQSVQDAFLAPVSEITRRIEIYEQDGQTPWRPDLWDELLVAGTISADNSSDERRTLDLTLANPDSAIDPTIGKLWYDKVIKPFYGVKLSRDVSKTKVAIIEAASPADATAFIQMISGPDVVAFYRPNAMSMAELAAFDVVVAMSGPTAELTKVDLISQAFDSQKSVMTVSTISSASQFPVLGAATASPAAMPSGTVIEPSTGAELTSAVPAPWTIAKPFSLARITRTHQGVEVPAVIGQSPAILSRAFLAGARWIHLQQPGFTPDWFSGDTAANCAAFLAAAIRWLDVSAYTTHWETQLGEFVQDSASVASESPDLVEISARDYVKRCLVSRLVASTTYEKDRPIEDVIGNMALNSKVRKIALPATGARLDRDMTWEADTDRWSIMKELATSHNYDLYFDAHGVLVMEKFRDPSTSPVDLLLNVGPLGNLVSKGLRTSDSQLFNHVVVVGEGADADTPPVWAEAINNNPASPSRVDELGDRVIRHQAATVTSLSQAQELAKSMLSVAALEEFELNFSIPLLPWIEPNQVLALTEEAAGTWGPDRFLLSTVTMPLDLSPMSGTGKRIINVT